MNVKLGMLQEIDDLRKAWPHEALDFTPWLAGNISILGNTLGIDIDVEETESSVGSFNVDIFARDADTGRRIIIENQLEDTDHDHLGKLITYASGKSASLVIWVVKRAREEHRAAIEWLNNHTDEEIGFVLCEVKLYRIEDSLMAPHFSIIERPNNWAKEMKNTKTSSPRAILPRITDMLNWKVVKPNDILVASGTSVEARLLPNGHVLTDEEEELSIQRWLCGVYGWTSVETYKYTIHKETGKTLSDLRREYMEGEGSSYERL